MKVFKYIISFCLLLFLLPACTEDDLDVKNVERITVESYFNKAEHAYESLVPAYAMIGQRGTYGRLLLWMTVAMGDLALYERPTLESFTFNSDEIEDVYLDLYRGITACNTAIENIPIVLEKDAANFSEEEAVQLLAEARFLRALYNFYLTTFFNTPPLVNDLPSSFTQTYGNSTREEFLAQIELDLIGGTNAEGEQLKGAIDVLPISYNDQNVGRATKGAALALMAKTYLYMQNWPEAKEYFKKVIDLNHYALSKPVGNDSIHYVYAYLCNFTPKNLIHPDGTVYKAENNSESVYEIQFVISDHNKNLFLPLWMVDGHLYTLLNGYNSYRNTSVTPNFVEEFETATSHEANLSADPRRAASIFFPGDTLSFDQANSAFYNTAFDPDDNLLPNINTGYGIRKYLFPIHFTGLAPYGDPNNIRLIRYADVLLMYAEAAYHENDLGEALWALNQVRERAGMPLYESTADVTVDAIVHERIVELGLEGVRYFDLTRWALLDEAQYPEWPNAEDILNGWIKGKNEFFPIPETEITKMRGDLSQNPGW